MHDELNNQDYIPIAPNSVPIIKLAKILEQLKKSIFEISYNDSISTGFFCKINYGEKVIKSLIMNYIILKSSISQYII